MHQSLRPVLRHWCCTFEAGFESSSGVKRRGLDSDGDVTVIEKDALVTGRVVQAKRGGRWGKARKLSWIMTDVIAVDLSRIPVQISNDLADNRNRIRGISHGGEVAARAIVLGALFPPAAAIGVIGGAFKRGGDAVLTEGKRFVIYVQKGTNVTVTLHLKCSLRLRGRRHGCYDYRNHSGECQYALEQNYYSSH